MKSAFSLLALSLMACSSTPAPDVFSGYYRQGFEQSDFYTVDGEGPYWLTGNETVFTQLQEYLVPKQGRGSYITVAMTVEGRLQTKGQYGHLERYPMQLNVTQIHAIRAISQEAYDSEIQVFLSDRDEGR